MTPFSTRENALRLPDFRRNSGDDALFAEMNRVLLPISLDVDDDIDRPTVFVFGLPRSGTTLTYQLISQCLDIGYINNLTARFWLSPIHGIALSQAVLGNPTETDFFSEFGKSRGPYGPNEFGYFWNYWLRMNDIEDMIVFNRPKPHIDWRGLGRAVRRMQGRFESGMVFKTIYAGSHTQAFAETFAMPLFVYVERAPTDVALSVLAARKAYYGRADAWWSTYSPDYFDLMNLEYNHQIAGQVRSLRRMYETALNSMEPDLVLRFDYSRLCKEPDVVLDMLRERILRVYGVNLRQRLSPPKSFPLRTRPASLDEEQRAVLAAMAEWAA